MFNQCSSVSFSFYFPKENVEKRICKRKSPGSKLGCAQGNSCGRPSSSATNVHDRKWECANLKNNVKLETPWPFG